MSTRRLSLAGCSPSPGPFSSLLYLPQPPRSIWTYDPLPLLGTTPNSLIYPPPFKKVTSPLTPLFLSLAFFILCLHAFLAHDMNGKRPPSSAVAVLTIPLLLLLPHTLVAALSSYDYTPSPLENLWLNDGRSTLARRADADPLGYYIPMDYGGYLMTVSCSLSLRFLLVPFGYLPPCRGYFTFRSLIILSALRLSFRPAPFRACGSDSISIRFTRSDLESQ